MNMFELVDSRGHTSLRFKLNMWEHVLTSDPSRPQHQYVVLDSFSSNHSLSLPHLQSYSQTTYLVLPYISHGRRWANFRTSVDLALAWTSQAAQQIPKAQACFQYVYYLVLWSPCDLCWLTGVSTAHSHSAFATVVSLAGQTGWLVPPPTCYHKWYLKHL